MTVRILEIAAIATPECIGGRLDDPRPGFAGLPHDHVDVFLRGDVVAERQLGGAGGSFEKPRVMCKACPRPDGKLKACLQVEEGHGTMFELLTDDPLGRKAEAVPVERDGALKILDGKRDDRDAGFDGGLRAKSAGSISCGYLFNSALLFWCKGEPGARSFGVVRSISAVR